MNKKSIKKFLCGTVVACSLLNAGLPSAFAAKINFDINTTGDTTTNREFKTNTTNNFFVEADYFSKSGTLNCMSCRVDDTSVYSNNVAYSYRQVGTSKGAAYKKTATYGYQYYMSGTSSISNMNVTGLYTP